MKFIELHDYHNKKPVLIGVEWIAYVSMENDYSVVHIGVRSDRSGNSRPHTLLVDESYYKIKEMIE